MLKYFIISIFSILLLGCNSSALVFENAVCITNVNTIDAKDGLSENMTVVIKGNKIVKVAPSNSISLADKNEIIDGTGKYMIPGLWDAHVHFAYIEDLAPSMFHLFLAYGITSVRDTGGKIDFVKEWKDKAEANPTGAPRVKIAGPLIDGMPNVYDGSSPGRPPLSVGAGSVDEAIRIVNYLDSMGVDLIKAYEMLTPEQFAAVTKRAKELGLRVTGHIPLSMDAITASAGMNSMEHLRNIEMSCAEDWQGLQAQRLELLSAGKSDQGGVLRSRIHTAQRTRAFETQDEANTEKVLDALLKNESWQVPTLALSTGASERPYLRPEWQASFKYLPKDLEDKWKESIANFTANPPTEAQKGYTQWAENMVRKMNDKGITFMAGTDCPIFFLPPGRSLHEELAKLVEFGLSPLQAIETATANPAEFFDMQDELGFISEGMIADLLLLDANPLDDISHTLKLNTMIKDGKIYNRKSLDEMLANLDKT